METQDHRPATWVVYGAYGFTGELVARRAVACGERPILAGRDAARLEPLARELGLEHRVADLRDADQLDGLLEDVRAVAHCAGPFSATSAPMVAACLRTGTHYLDITGEIAVLEAVLAQDAAAREAGVALVPGAGFDVVPTDCLAALVAADVPDATSLEIAFLAGGGVSRGTARTALEGATDASMARVDGALVPVAAADRMRTIDFGDGVRARVTAISWGDLATAPRSTGIDNVVVYTAIPGPVRVAARVANVVMRVPLAGAATRRALGVVVGRIPNPSPTALAGTTARIWARATAPDGRSSTRVLTTPNGYALTADAVVQASRALVDGSVAAGAHTPSQALGAEFASSLEGCALREPVLA